MNLKKYCRHTFSLLLCCGCMYKHTHTLQEKKEYYTQNPYKLYTLESFQSTIIQASPDAITSLRKKLADRSPKWSTSGTEKKPYELWNNFLKQETPKEIVTALQKAGYDTTLLENYYNRLSNLFRDPTEEHEKKVIEAIKKLQANPKLEQAFKECIATRYNNPATIYLTKVTLEYQELLYFILGKTNMLYRKLKKWQSNLVKWQEDGHPTGQALWKLIQQNYNKLLSNSKLYKYKENQEAIEQSLRLMDQLADDPYSLSYKDFLETLPHGIKQLKDILYEVGLKEKNDIDIKSLTNYLGLIYITDLN